MSATAQMQRPAEKTGTWSSVFPNETVTEQQSALFVKKLLAVAVSSITYLRAIFPEYAFGDRCLEDLNLKILKDDSSCPGSCQVINWVKGCFDAMDKKYLKMLIIGIYVDPDDPETVIESYSFKFSYTNQGQGIDIFRNKKKISSAHTATDETKKATIMLLRTIVVLTQSLQSLPDDVMMTMKLLYYDDVTPADYEPPGFQPADCAGFQFEDDPMNIKVGDVSTPFHTVKLRIKTDARQFEMRDEIAEDVDDSECVQENTENQNQTEVTQISVVDNEDKENLIPQMVTDSEQIVPEPVEGDVPTEQTPMKPGMSGQALIADDVSQTSTQVDEEEDLGVKCPCGCNEDDGLMILCAICKHWQHGVCFQVLKEEDAPERHICDSCGQMDDPELIPTDPHLHGQTDLALQAICLWRRSLLCCFESNRLIVPGLAKRLGIETTVAQGLVNRLEKEGYVKAPTKGKRLGKVVNKDKLRKEGLAKYFKKTPKQPAAVFQDMQNKRERERNSNDVNEKESGMDVEVDASQKKTTGKKSDKSEIDELAAQAEEMSLLGMGKCSVAKKTSGKLAKKDGKAKADVNGNMPPPQPQEVKRGRKRIAVLNQEHEFDISDSQEFSQDISYDNSQPKRPKASQASKSIKV